MKYNFKRALGLVLRHEGGWSDHPQDPGGATMKGVTLDTYRTHFGREKTRIDLRNIPDSHLQEIYYNGYWRPIRGDDLPAGVDIVVFDFAVNAGPRRAIKTLQGVIGAGVDGIIGPITLEKLQQTHPSVVIEAYSDKRLDFYRGLKTFDTFGEGWTRRTEETREFALTFSKGVKVSKPSTVTEKKLPSKSFYDFLKSFF